MKKTWSLATNPWLLLLIPGFLALRNRLLRMDRGGRLRSLILSLLVLAFWIGTFWFFFRVLTYFRSIPELGLVLSQKLLGMVFVTFFAILFFSNVITALSTYFLSRDLQLLVPAPIPPARLYAARFVQTVVDSSWMVLLFGLPAFLAFGIVHGGGESYYLMTVLTLIPFLLIPAALGITVTMLLAYLLPAQRTKDLLALFSVLFLGLLALLFRILQPEKLVNPETFSDFLAFLSAMQAPSSPLLPSTWAAEVLLPFLGIKQGEPLFYYLLLLSTALFLMVAGSSLSSAIYPTGWSKAQEGRHRRGLYRVWDRVLALIAAPFPFSMHAIVVKDLKTFFRDTGQWSQLFLLLALVIVYVYNFSVLPVGGVSASFYLQNAIAFFNLALAAFVIAAIAVRFVFPAISLEGKAFWVLKSAPVPLRGLWWSKFWVSFFPLFFLGEILVTLTNHFLHVSSFMMVLAAFTLLFLILGLVSLGMALGTAYPKFAFDNAAQIATGFGGVLYMVLCITFIGVVVILEAWPVYIFFLSRLYHFPLSLGQWIYIFLSFALAFLVCVGVFWFAARWSVGKLEEMEI
jgi:ABC-2 type transport system permease protein